MVADSTQGDLATDSMTTTKRKKSHDKKKSKKQKKQTPRKVHELFLFLFKGYSFINIGIFRTWDKEIRGSNLMTTLGHKQPCPIFMCLI